MAYIPLTDLPVQLQDSVTSANMSSGTLEFYLAGTTTATPLFSDSSGTSIGTSITLNSGGYPESGGNVIGLFRDQSIALKVVCKNSSGSVVWTMDNIPAVASFDSTSSTKLDGIEAGADVTDATNVGAVVNGTQEVFIRAEEMYLPTTDGAAALATVEGTAGMPCYRGWAFDGTSAEYVEFVHALPKRYNLGTVTVQVYWTSVATDTDGVTWNARALAISDSDPFAASYGTPQSVDDTLLGAAGDLHVTSQTSALTIGGSPADGDLINVRIGRDPDNANDTASEDAVLVGVKLRFTSDALNDD